MATETREERLRQACLAHGALAAYLFGSRAADGLRLLRGEAVDPRGSDLDIGVYGATFSLELTQLVLLELELAEVFAPLRVDVVPLDRVDGIFQARAIDGNRIFALDSTRADFHELLVMRRAADLLHHQRQRELDLFGVSTT